MNRRGFLAALAGLPLVGKLFPQPETPHIGPMMDEAERRFRQIRKQKVTLTCVGCDCIDVVTLPAEMVLTGMLKTGKHICEDCRQLTDEDWIWHSQH